jgi:hypothetical protein
MSIPGHEKILSDLSQMEFLGLLAGDPRVVSRLEAGESLRVTTQFRYPGRFGPVVLYIEPGQRDRSGDQPLPVTISDGTELVRSLEEQGMDPATDMIISRTVFRAVREVENAGLANGRVFIDSDVRRLSTDIWRLLQLIAEVIGLRYSKYKEALVRLSQKQHDTNLIEWTER